MRKEANAILGIVKTPADLRRVQQHLFYHIPVRSAPLLIREQRAEYLAFYQPKSFKARKYRVEFYAAIKNIRKLPRRVIIPDQPQHPRAKELYYKVSLKWLRPLPKLIPSQRPRRNPFIVTSYDKLLNAREYNELVFGTPIEERMWHGLIRKNIAAEREFVEYLDKYGRRYLVLDFAIFCKNGKIDIECDGDTYHTSKAQVANDKDKRNILTTKDWKVLQFPTKEIMQELDKSLNIVCDTINSYGGILTTEDEQPKYFPKKSKGDQLDLF